MKYLTKYIMSLLLTLVCVSCQDDMFSDMESTVASKPGQYNLSLEMMFAPEEEVELNSRSAGDRISDISNLFIALFDNKGDYVDHWYFSKDKGNWDKVFISSTIAGTDTDPDKICKVTTNISIPYNGSEMYLVAVANMGDVSNDYSTLTEFRALKFDWDTTWAEGSNCQMSGYFTTTKEEYPRGTEILRDNGIPTITLNGGTTTLHAWLRRAASKVTVDFDASGLRENIWIYIKNVRVRDIPKSCTAFNINTPNTKADILTDVGDGEALDYTQGKTEWRDWPAVSKTKSNLNDIYPDAHSTTSRSLFFYENMQGEGKDKAQIVEGDSGSTPSFPDGGIEGNKGYKDDKPFGTYVEVNAYYYSTADNNINAGNITYRFMLGKDIKKDYNVERNHHYKLTLSFNGNANDADWHIDYTYAEKLYIPETYYISSLYGQRMHLPITIGKLDKIMPSLGNDGYVEVTAEIIESHWYPDPPATKGSESGKKTNMEDYYNEDLVHDDHKGPQTGFLTLHASEYSRMNKSNYVGRGKSGDKTYLKNYWIGKSDENTVNQGKRTFKLDYATKTLFGDEEGDLYQTTIDDRKRNMVFYMPLYTRALFLVKEWSYTGNNPYEEFTRSAQVKITVKVFYKNGNEYKRLRTNTETVKIVQVPRIFNPKGVYRKNGNNNPFEVTLMQASKESKGKQYEPFVSKGPWSAQIESASSNSKISINGQKAVFGSTDSPINFTINFSSSSSSKENQYAIILIRYHNYTCNHRILVRQGYEPDIVSKNSTTKWHCFNLRTGAMEATSPVEFGSLFKYGNLNQAIADENLTENYFNTKAESRSLVVLDKDGKRSKTTWENIKPEPFTSSDGGKFPNTTNGKITLNNGKTAKIATTSDFEALRDKADTEYGYGICYGDESLTTLSVGVAGGSYYYNKTKTHTMGMLGCFIYSKDNSHNIFLPAGPTGYGVMDRFGAIRYAGADASLKDADYRPLLWRLFQNYGVNYWVGDRKYTTDPWNGKQSYATAWDINISSFDFNTYFMNAHDTHTNAYDASKAFPIRLVEVN